MKIINKSMDVKDLETEKGKQTIEELKQLIKEYESKGCKISSWYGESEPTEGGIKFGEANKGYDYKPILEKRLDIKYPNFLLWEIHWVYTNLNFKKGDLVLDIGGACSLFSFYLASKGMKVIAIDLNPKIVEEANRIAKVMNLDYTAICSDAEDFLLNTKEKFDFITSICVFEHIEINKRKRIVKNLHNCLKKDGKIAFTFDYKNPSRFIKIDNVEDIEAHFLCSDKLVMLENQKFYDNNTNYLVSLFYRKPRLWRWKFRLILNGEFKIWEYFKTKNYNDYTFGAIFLEIKK